MPSPAAPSPCAPSSYSVSGASPEEKLAVTLAPATPESHEASSTLMCLLFGLYALKASPGPMILSRASPGAQLSARAALSRPALATRPARRSEEHTSELQSRLH